MQLGGLEMQTEIKQFMTSTVTLIRRVNLGHYEYYELHVSIQDVDEMVAFRRAVKVLVEAAETLGMKNKVNVYKKSKGASGLE